MIERGDEVYHKPSGEDWVVARAGVDSDGEYVEPAGWPPCRARASDCVLTKKGAHIELLDGDKPSREIVECGLTEEARERAAKALAEATNGGKWETHYVESQRELWRQRVDAGMRRKGKDD